MIGGNYESKKGRTEITKVVDNLERDGLVKGERDDTDRRYYRVTFTPRGRKLFEKVLPLHVMQVEKEMTRLTGNERKHLSKLCIKLGKE